MDAVLGPPQRRLDLARVRPTPKPDQRMRRVGRNRIAAAPDEAADNTMVLTAIVEELLEHSEA